MNLFEIDYTFKRHKLLLELEYYLSESTAYKDPRYSELDNFRLVKGDHLKIAKEETNRFLDYYNIQEGSGRYYTLEPNSILPMHVDYNTTCSVNTILNDNTASIQIENNEYVYSTAILNTQALHGVNNNDKLRCLFKISFFDLSFEELVQIVRNKNST